MQKGEFIKVYNFMVLDGYGYVKFIIKLSGSVMQQMISVLGGLCDACLKYDLFDCNGLHKMCCNSAGTSL